MMVTYLYGDFGKERRKAFTDEAFLTLCTLRPFSPCTMYVSCNRGVIGRNQWWCRIYLACDHPFADTNGVTHGDRGQHCPCLKDCPLWTTDPPTLQSTMPLCQHATIAPCHHFNSAWGLEEGIRQGGMLVLKLAVDGI